MALDKQEILDTYMWFKEKAANQNEAKVLTRIYYAHTNEDDKPETKPKRHIVRKPVDRELN